jgi:hypothetical protein
VERLGEVGTRYGKSYFGRNVLTTAILGKNWKDEKLSNTVCIVK